MPSQHDEDVADRSTNRSPITALATGAARNWKVTISAWLAVIVLGLTAYFGGLAREGFPPINVPIVVVDGPYFVDDPELVDAGVTLPLSQAFADVEGVADVQSFALGNAFAIVVEFDDSYSSTEGAALLEPAVEATSLPPEAAVSVRSLDATKFLEVYDILVSVAGPEGTTAAELEAEASKLRDALAEDPNIVRADVRNLLTEGVDPATGDTIVRQTRFTRVALEGTEAYADAVAVGLVRDPDNSDLDILTFSDSVQSRLDDSTSVLSDGFTAQVTADFATDIRTQIGNLTGNLLTGLVAVALVSLLFIGWRASVITAGFMATVMLAALIGLWAFGYTLNTITLFGLILTLGLLVDDAIVISESLDANRDEADDEIGVVRTAINRVGTASFAGTLTTVLVFAPILFVGGILGEFIRAIPTTVIITLLLSFLFSIIFIPALAKPFLLRGGGGANPLIGLIKTIAGGAGRLAAYPSGNGPKGWLVGTGLFAAAMAVVITGFTVVAPTLGFNIFPPSKDSNTLSITVSFDPGTTIEEAQDLSRAIDDAVVEILGDDLVQSQYLRGNEQTILTFVDLTPFDERTTTAPVYVERLEAALAGFEGGRISIGQIDNGPPVEDFPFAAQIATSDENLAETEALAFELRDALLGTELEKESGEDTEIIGAIVSTEGQVFRTNGERQIEVRASFSNDDLTNNLDATEALVGELFPPEELAARGLSEDAIAFDFGLESDNQEDFAGLQVALLVAVVLVTLLLVLQFRSIVQPLLILMAIPFSLFGVFAALSLTDNPLSFFVFVGLIALIGVVVNNTILLIDAANQGRRAGLSAGEAIGQAVNRRFRPLVATTLTTVVGLLPLALADPFWEALSFTLIGGLLSSTFLVLLAFPVMYLAVERVRTPIRNLARRGLGWPEVT